ncbi:acyltransferase family protein [Compostimonas suwonensis]|nr:acyltransferase [Compostimonas suwonensis]
MHFCIFVAYPAMPDGAAKDFWTPIISELALIRIPLLLVLSGMLVSGYVRDGWRNAKTRSRVRSTAYIYLIWVLVYAVLSKIFPEGMPYQIIGLPDMFSQLYQPDTPLWFIFALTLYTAVFATMSRLSPALVLTAVAAFSLWSATIPGDRGANFWYHILTYGIYFGIGVYGRSLLAWLASPSRWWATGALLVVGVVLRSAVLATPMPWALASALQEVTSTFLVLGVIGVIVVWCQAGWFTRSASRLGTRTLPIYVLHLPMIWLILVIDRRLPLANLSGAWAWPIAGTIVVIAGCLVAEWAIRRAHLGYLFDPPSWVGQPRWVTVKTSRAEEVARSGPRVGSETVVLRHRMIDPRGAAKRVHASCSSDVGARSG